MPVPSEYQSREMDRAYWDDVAENYENEIFSVHDNDTDRVVEQRIQRFANNNHLAADLGCGIGKFTPLLARNFKRVHACDLSEKLLVRARKACRMHENINFFQTDLGAEPHPVEPVNFVLCINVLIMASLDIRLRALRAVTAQVKRGGHLVLVVPSVESMLYTRFRMVDWCLRDGQDCTSAIRENLPRSGSLRALYQGIRPIEGVPTKHYLREELQVLMTDHHMEVLEIKKLTYPWTTEFSDPPDWMDSPFPWDWLVVARRE